MSKEQWVKSSF